MCNTWALFEVTCWKRRSISESAEQQPTLWGVNRDTNMYKQLIQWKDTSKFDSALRLISAVIFEGTPDQAPKELVVLRQKALELDSTVTSMFVLLNTHCNRSCLAFVLLRGGYKLSRGCAIYRENCTALLVSVERELQDLVGFYDCRTIAPRGETWAPFWIHLNSSGLRNNKYVIKMETNIRSHREMESYLFTGPYCSSFQLALFQVLLCTWRLHRRMCRWTQMNIINLLPLHVQETMWACL